MIRTWANNARRVRSVWYVVQSHNNWFRKDYSFISCHNYWVETSKAYIYIFYIIKWSGILANFALSWLAETCFPRQYLRVSTPQMLNDGLFGVSVMSQRKRRFSCQIFAWTGEFGVHFLMTSQYTHLISRRFWLRLTTPWTFLCD